MDGLASVIVAVVTIVLWTGEFLLVGAYLVVPFLLGRFGLKRSARSAVTAVILAALIAHLCGFKLFGRPAVTNLARLESPRELAKIAPPNLLYFSDGTIARLKGVYVPEDLEFASGTDTEAESVLKMLRKHRSLGDRLTVELPSNSMALQEAVFLRRINTAGCGNARPPSFLPRRISNHVRGDLGTALVEVGAALPSREVLRSDPSYRAELLKRFKAWKARVTGQDPEIVAIAKELQSLPDQLENSARLLVDSRATNEFPRLARELRASDALRVPGARALLLQIDYGEARDEMARLEADPATTLLMYSDMASTLSRHNDFRGYDKLLNILNGDIGSSEERQRVLQSTVFPFRFLDRMADGGAPFPEIAAPMFPRWYAQVRDRLVWHSQPGGGGYGLRGGSSFDSNYFATMAPFWDEYDRLMRARYPSIASGSQSNQSPFRR